MPYEKHPVFTPVGEGTLIWRYLDFTKLVSMLSDRALFFCRSDLLGDRFEGSVSRASLGLREATFSELQARHPGFPREEWDRMNAKRSAFNQALPKRTFINCWSAGRYESVALWRLYVGDRDGVALRSTFGRLTRSIAACPERIYVGRVQYIDYDVDPIPETNILYPFVHKRQGFDYEHEVRALVQDLDLDELNRLPPVPVDAPGGKVVPCDIGVLVTAIRVSPTAEPWFVALVQSVLEKYGLDVPLEQSDLVGNPVY